MNENAKTLIEGICKKFNINEIYYDKTTKKIYCIKGDKIKSITAKEYIKFSVNYFKENNISKENISETILLEVLIQWISST